MKSIAELESEIRDFINRPRKQTKLLSDLASWNMLCSALDVIGDTELALEAYLAWTPQKEDGEKYLLVYGALQVMEVQQDAVKFVSESLAIPYARPTELTNIRMVRSELMPISSRWAGVNGSASSTASSADSRVNWPLPPRPTLPTSCSSPSAAAGR